MRLWIKELSEEQRNVTVEDDATVLELKGRLCEERSYKCEPERLGLVFKGRILRDKHLVADYRLKEEDVLLLTAPFRKKPFPLSEERKDAAREQGPSASAGKIRPLEHFHKAASKDLFIAQEEVLEAGQWAFLFLSRYFLVLHLVEDKEGIVEVPPRTEEPGLSGSDLSAGDMGISFERETVERLMALGFGLEEVLEALFVSDGDEEVAANRLFSSAEQKK